MVEQTLTDKLKEKIEWLPGFVDIKRVNRSRSEAFDVVFEPQYWNTFGYANCEKNRFSISQEGAKGLALASEFTKELMEGCYNPKPADIGAFDYDKFPYTLMCGGDLTFGVADGRIWFGYHQKSGRVYHPSIRIGYTDERFPRKAQLVSDEGINVLKKLNQFGKTLPSYLSLDYSNGIYLGGNVPAERVIECAGITKGLRDIMSLTKKRLY